MAEYVFISYESGDAGIAAKVSSAVEGAGIPCSGSRLDSATASYFRDFGGGIPIMVVIVSSRSVRSPRVCAEVDLATHAHMGIIPFRIDCVPIAEMRPLCPHRRWIDAFEGAIEDHIESLAWMIQTHFLSASGAMFFPAFPPDPWSREEEAPPEAMSVSSKQGAGEEMPSVPAHPSKPGAPNMAARETDEADADVAGVPPSSDFRQAVRGATKTPADSLAIACIDAQGHGYKSARVWGPYTAKTTPRGVFGREDGPRRDKVDCTVFAPPAVRAGDAALVQVFAHRHREARKAKAAAKEFDADAVRRGVKSLGTRIRRGSKLTFELSIPPLVVEKPVRELVWRGDLDSVEFAVGVPEGLSPRTVIGGVGISQDSVPIGEIHFKLEVAAKDAAVAGEPVPAEEAVRYTRAFISYSSEDRPEVLRRVPMLTAVGIRFFQDVLSLDPGDEWMPKLYKWIDESDVFLLFWSSNAKRSEWVEKEWRHALARPVPGFIRPVVIEGPPIPEPPPELAHIHFGDRTRYFLV